MSFSTTTHRWSRAHPGEGTAREDTNCGSSRRFDGLLRRGLLLSHGFRVGLLAQHILRQVKGRRSPAEQSLLLAGICHDWGKLLLPVRIVLKAGPLSTSERLRMQRHVIWGQRLLRAIPGSKEVQNLVAQHHERWDGKGYPLGLRGSEILLEARILSLADCYDALRSDRVYRTAWPTTRVVRYFSNQAGSAFDPELVEVILDNWAELECLRTRQRAELKLSKKTSSPVRGLAESGNRWHPHW